MVSSSTESFLQRAVEVRKCGTWANEDITLATADYLKQDSHVITANRTTAPLVYSPSIPSNKNPILIAFYEPGHYRAVTRVFNPVKCSTANVNVNAENLLPPVCQH